MDGRELVEAWAALYAILDDYGVTEHDMVVMRDIKEAEYLAAVNAVKEAVRKIEED